MRKKQQQNLHECEHCFMCGELIDSLYLLLIWVIEIGFIKLNTEKK